MSWKERLHDAIDPALRDEIDTFATQIELRRQGKLEETVFAELRLRRGVYGQRYDNGQRNDGSETRTLHYPSGDLTKGPNTVWDAPGMMRIKLPYGALTAAQLEALAEVAEEYADDVVHATTRQDVQLHFVHIEDTPDIMRRLAAVGITTREACGNVVRNVAGCPLAGVCHDEAFDITPYARACAMYLLGHPDAQAFGRKFKISFSGCKEHACGLATMHDLGFVARVRPRADGTVQRVFEVHVGGGLGAVPHQAKLYDEALPVQELLPLTQAICRVFAAHGEKRNRARARVKFLIAKIGLDAFRELVEAERQKLAPDPRWTAFLDALHAHDDKPLHAAAPLEARALEALEDDKAAAFARWRSTNASSQRQPGYSVVTVTLPLGDISARQLRALASAAREHCGDTIRVTVEQNLVLRWVPDRALIALWRALGAAGLAEPGAGSIVDVTSCPGTDTCKLGISASRGLAAELRTQLSARNLYLDEAVKGLRIKVSGCFNSCGQHHVADLGFYGVSRKVGSHAVPHFQVVVGGQWSENAASYGLAIGAVPSRAIPQAVALLLGDFVDKRERGERFQAYTRRVGKVALKASLAPLAAVPAYDGDRSYYSDWADPREFTIGDMGIGECAGEIVSPLEFGLADSERVVFEAQLALDEHKSHSAAEKAYRAMLTAASALVRSLPEGDDVAPTASADSDGDEGVVSTFRARLYDTKLFFDPYAGGKFANYLFRAHRERGAVIDVDRARQRVEEAQLFIEAAHACSARIA
ncbi:MAG: nitrite/sulfite reductase [Myxococcales bacterium]|nr:nitrite/sulfite reductase [Myxococcales bacterium]